MAKNLLIERLRVLRGATNYESAPLGQAAQTIIETIAVGQVDSNNSDTPKLVGQFTFNPTEYALAGTTMSLELRVTASNAGGVASTNVEFYNLTDDEQIALINFTTPTVTTKTEALTIGAGAGEIDASAKIYEVRIYVDAPDLVDDAIKFGGAELRVINTID